MLKRSFGKILVINWAVTGPSEPESRVINTAKTFLTDFSLVWQISGSEEPQSGVRLHLSDGHITDLTWPWLADRLRNTKCQHSGFGWVVTTRWKYCKSSFILLYFVQTWNWKEHLLLWCDDDMTVHQRISNCRDPVKYSLARKSSADPVLWGPGHIIKMHTFDQIISDEKFLLSWLQGPAPESERSQSHRCRGFIIQANVRDPMHQLAPMSPHHHHQSIIVPDWHWPQLTLWRRRHPGSCQTWTDRR